MVSLTRGCGAMGVELDCAAWTREETSACNSFTYPFMIGCHNAEEFFLGLQKVFTLCEQVVEILSINVVIDRFLVIFYGFIDLFAQCRHFLFELVVTFGVRIKKHASIGGISGLV